MTVLRTSHPLDVNRQNIVQLASPPWHGSDDSVMTNGRIMVRSSKEFLLANNSIVLLFLDNSINRSWKYQRESDIYRHFLKWPPQLRQTES